MTGSIHIGRGDPFNALDSRPTFDGAHRRASELARKGQHVKLGRLGEGYGIWRVARG